MTYLEALALINKIEQEYDVMSVKVHGISVWTAIRIYLVDHLSRNREAKMSTGNIRIVLHSLFSYNPLKAFEQFKIWAFTSQERRKFVDGKYVLRVSGVIPLLEKDTLMIEKPDRVHNHFYKSQIPESSIVSESWQLLLTHFYEHMFRFSRFRIENEQLLIDILRKVAPDFDYRYRIRLLLSQRKAMKSVLSLSKPPKCVFIECPYVSMGYLWAIHERTIRIVEMQHGVLNGNHFAYCANQYEPCLTPDAIAVYGDVEYDYFTTGRGKNYCKEVYKTGYYMLDLSSEWLHDDIFTQYRKHYKYIVVASGQADYEDTFLSFVENVAQLQPETLFFYIPRNKLDYQASHENLILLNDVNIYEYLKWADIHITISSTTCLEAQYFKKPTVFYDYENMASRYYKEILSPENGVCFIYKPEEFSDALKNLVEGRDEIRYRDFFYHNHKERMTELLGELL